MKLLYSIAPNQKPQSKLATASTYFYLCPGENNQTNNNKHDIKSVSKKIKWNSQQKKY